jgi:hypothetical protein
MDIWKLQLLATVALFYLILIVAALFSTSALTISVLFVIDIVVTMARSLFERSVAAQPPEQEPPMDPYGILQPLYDTVREKRGSVRLHKWLPPVYPRNLPYVVAQCTVSVFALLPVVLLTWTALEPLEGGSGLPLVSSLVLVSGLVLIGIRHALVVRSWAGDGRYAAASPRTIRRTRDFLALGIVGCLVVVVLSAADPAPANVTAATVIATALAFPLACRDTGVAPWPLAPDPTSDATECSPTLSEGTPHRTFETDRAVIRWLAVKDGFVYAVVVSVFTIALLAPAGLLLFRSFDATLLGVTVGLAAGAFAAFPTPVAFRWLGVATEEYRVYGDSLVAYDTRLDEPQWRIPLSEITHVETADDTLGTRVLGVFDTGLSGHYPVLIRLRDGTSRRLETLADPEGFVHAVTEMWRVD